MKIQAVNFNNNINKSKFGIKSNKPKSETLCAHQTCEYSSENVKANYLTFCGNYRKVRDIELLDNDTLEYTKASLQHKKDYCDEYIITKDGKKLGYMTFDKSANLGHMYDVAGFRDGVMPRIATLRSLEGDKYSGIGTQFVKEAVERSFQEGYDGLVCLNAIKNFASSDSDYRCTDSPIPFYYRLGFRSPSPEINRSIEIALKLKIPEMLPNETFMVLTPQNIYKFDDYYNSKFPPKKDEK